MNRASLNYETTSRNLIYKKIESLNAEKNEEGIEKINNKNSKEMAKNGQTLKN
jgi:hypothetical protein